MAGRAFIARGISDPDDRLISADEPLSGLQLRCGGELPGLIAVPELLETVRKARRSRLKLANSIEAQDGEDKITAWIEVEPALDGSGCSIGIATWQETPLNPEEVAAVEARRIAIDRQCAELAVLLDPNQKIRSATHHGEALKHLAEQMNNAKGSSWTELVSFASDQRPQSDHWQLLNGAKFTVPGSNRQWRATLIPIGAAKPGSEGFELLLVADEPAPAPPTRSKPSAADREQIALAHDIAPILRKPINRIIANAETIRGKLAGPLKEEYSNYAADIAAAGEHLLGLIDDLADMEIIEADGFVTAPDKIDLGDIARRAVGILGVRAQAKRITLLAPSEELKLPATGEFRRSLQILLNLTGNAIAYSPEGSTVTLEPGQNGRMAQIAVRDEGPGLTKDQQAVVFEKFERLGRGGDGGSGLGLYISRRLARAMKGDIIVDSEPGEGARFVLSLPARDT